MHWDCVDIAECVAATLEDEARHLDIEQSPYGLDAGDTARFDTLIQHALLSHDYGVWPDMAYPATPRRRCAMALSPDGAPVAAATAEPGLFDPADPIAPEAAFWLETAVAMQCTPEGPNPKYSTALLAPFTSGVRHLAQDPSIFHAGLLMILFTRSVESADHDLMQWLKHAADHGLPVGPPARRGLGIPDRHGHGRCDVALFPIGRM